MSTLLLTVDNFLGYNGCMQEFIHPELKDGEVFFTNTNATQFKKMRWDTKRKGVVAYDGNGAKLSVADWFPVFLQEAELRLARYNLRSARNFWREINK